MKIRSARVNLSTLRVLSYVIFGGFLVATNGFEPDCGLEETEPCKIFSYGDLKNVENDGFFNRHYALMNDIQAPTDPPETFVPIGYHTNSWYEFSARSFEGNGHAIHNLFIDGEDLPEPRSGYSTRRLGLFSHLSHDAKVRNLILVNATVIGTEDSFVGVLAGSGGAGKIENVVVDNPTITGSTAGGLLGNGYGSGFSRNHDLLEITRCSVRGGTVNGAANSLFRNVANSRSPNLGGLVGRLSQFVFVTSSSAENVHVVSPFGNTNHDCGGLTGYLGKKASIRDSFATGSVSCGGNVGGLVGTATKATIASSYSVSTLTAGEHAGGLIGEMTRDERDYRNSSYCMVKNSFAVFEHVGAPPRFGPYCVGGNADNALSIKNNYCFNKGRDVDLYSKPGEFTMVKSLDHFLDGKENEPMIRWNDKIWTFEADKYPSNKLFVDSGGPYESKREAKGVNRVHLDRAAAVEGNYSWMVNNTRCSFDDPTILQPVLSCRGKANRVVTVCLSVKNGKLTKRHCRPVKFTDICPISACKHSPFLNESINRLVLKLNWIRTYLSWLDDTFAKRDYLSGLLEEAKDHLVDSRPVTDNIGQARRAVLKAQDVLRTLSLEILHQYNPEEGYSYISEKSKKKNIERLARDNMVFAGEMMEKCCFLPKT